MKFFTFVFVTLSGFLTSISDAHQSCVRAGDLRLSSPSSIYQATASKFLIHGLRTQEDVKAAVELIQRLTPEMDYTKALEQTTFQMSHLRSGANSRLTVLPEEIGHTIKTIYIPEHGQTSDGAAFASFVEDLALTLFPIKMPTLDPHTHALIPAFFIFNELLQKFENRDRKAFYLTQKIFTALRDQLKLYSPEASKVANQVLEKMNQREINAANGQTFPGALGSLEEHQMAFQLVLSQRAVVAFSQIDSWPSDIEGLHRLFKENDSPENGARLEEAFRNYEAIKEETKILLGWLIQEADSQVFHNVHAAVGWQPLNPAALSGSLLRLTAHSDDLMNGAPAQLRRLANAMILYFNEVDAIYPLGMLPPE